MMTLGGLTLGENSTGKNSLNVCTRDCKMYSGSSSVADFPIALLPLHHPAGLAYDDLGQGHCCRHPLHLHVHIHHSEAASCKLQVNEFHFILRILINIRTVLNLVLFFISGRFFAILEFRRLYFSIKKVYFNSYHIQVES